MEARYRIENGSNFIEVDRTEKGLDFLKKTRKTVCWKHCRIKDILQSHPSKVEKYVLVSLGNK
jgi:hypothetical protein